MSLMTLHCPECREDRLFERPHPEAERHGRAAERHDPAQCHDLPDYPDGGHGPGDPAELACVECGTALFAGFALPIMVGAPEHMRTGHHSPGRAA